MRKILPFMLITGLILAGCSGAAVPAPTATAVPSPTRVPTIIPPSLKEEIKLETQTGTAYTLSWSPDGETLAVASGSEITLMSADLQETLTILRPEDGALGVTWNPDMTRFATVSGFRHPTITVWDLDTAAAELIPAEEIRAGTDQYGVSWSPEGKLLATLAGDSKSVIQIWDTTKWENVTFDLPYTKPRRALQWSRDSSTVYGAGEAEAQMIVFALNVTDGTVQEIGKYGLREAEVVAVSPGQDRIAISDLRGVVHFYDIASGQVLARIKSVAQPVDIAWNPQRETLAILDYKATLQLWDVSP